MSFADWLFENGFKYSNILFAKEAYDLEQAQWEEIKSERNDLNRGRALEIQRKDAEIAVLKAEIERLKAELKAHGIPVQEPEKERKQLFDVLEYAGKFQTNDGMIDHLKRTMPELSQEDRTVVENLLKRDPEFVRREIKRMIITGEANL